MDWLSLKGIEFNQRSSPSNRDIVTSLVKKSDGIFIYVALARRLIVLMERSIIGTCSPREHIWRVAGRNIDSYDSPLNSLSQNTLVIVKPLVRYFDITNFNFFHISVAFLFVNFCIVMKSISLDLV